VGGGVELEVHDVPRHSPIDGDDRVSGFDARLVGQRTRRDRGDKTGGGRTLHETSIVLDVSPSGRKRLAILHG
jgi:hypothetical protein